MSKSHGDLSNLRPNSPPIQSLPASLHELHLSPGNYVDDTQNLFSPTYNRQARQAIPNNWMINGSGSQPSTTMEGCASTGQHNRHRSLYTAHSHHQIAAEKSTIPIEGLTSGYIQPLDFCVPVTRSHPGGENQRRETLHGDTGQNLAVEHIDISTAWNGLSDVDANELFRVHRAFVSTLKKMLANVLWQIYQQLQQQDSAGNIKPIHTMFSEGTIRGISFSRDQLVSEMAEALYSSKENLAKAKSEFLRMYLIATDTLIQYREDGPRDTSVTIRMRCDSLSLRPYPVVDAAWVPDSLIFEGLDESPLEGQSFSIIPRYYSKSAFRPTHFPKNVRYSIESESRDSPLSWLVWDDEIAGFTGIVPFYCEVDRYDRHLAITCRDPPQITSHSLKIAVQAVLVDDNGSSIRFERILRARLTIQVVPWYAKCNSRETKEWSSVPKSYQETRLASAAPGFALQDPRGSSRTPGQFPSRLSQRSIGAHLHAPNVCVPIGSVDSNENHSATSSSSIEAGLKKSDLHGLTQTQAYLMSKCAGLTREVQNFREQVMIFFHSGEPRYRTLHVPDPQESPKNTHSGPPDYPTGHSRPDSGSWVPAMSQCASEHLITPSLHGRDATLELEPVARFSVLPPSAIDLTTNLTLDSQASNDGHTLDATHPGWDPTPGLSTTSPFAAPGENPLTQNTHSAQEPRCLWRLPEQASISFNDTGMGRSSSRQHVEALSTPPMVKGELATSGQRGRQWRARSILSNIPPFKRSKENGKHPKQVIGTASTEPRRETLPLFDSEDEQSSACTQWSSGFFYNSFGPLRSLGSSTSLASEDLQVLHAQETASTNPSEDIKHRDHVSDCDMDTENTDSVELANESFPQSSGLEGGATPAEDVPSNSFFAGREGQVCPGQSFSTWQASTSSTCDSRSTSNDMEVIIEQDPHARKVSGLEQAKLWKLLFQLDSEKNWPGTEAQEVRLSEDEKKAMDEAMQRSLDDLHEGYDDIFLEDSSESSSNGDR